MFCSRCADAGRVWLVVLILTTTQASIAVLIFVVHIFFYDEYLMNFKVIKRT